MSAQDGGAAFPRPHTVADANEPGFRLGEPGMTLRDYFAGQALAGILASAHQEAHNNPDMAAEWAYDHADAMLRAREVR